MDQRICAICNATTEKLKLCGKCKKIRYCSVECQRSGWERHRSYCKILEGKDYPDGNTTFLWRNYVEISREYYHIRKNKLVNPTTPLYICIRINDYDKDFTDGTNEIKVVDKPFDRKMSSDSIDIVRKKKLAKENRAFVIFIPNRNIVTLPYKIPLMIGMNMSPEDIEYTIELGYQTTDDSSFDQKFESVMGKLQI